MLTRLVASEELEGAHEPTLTTMDVDVWVPSCCVTFMTTVIEPLAVLPANMGRTDCCDDMYEFCGCSVRKNRK